MHTPKSLLILTSFLLTQGAYADEWQHFQDMPENKGIYETILIEKNGIFSKEVIIWLRATYSLDEKNCNNLESTYDTKLSAKNMCIMFRKNEIKESIYKLSLNCSKKNIGYLESSSKNHFDKPVASSLDIGNHPGSLGYALIQHYCR